MNNGERYNPETNSWSNIAEMYSPRSNFGIEVGGWVVGGVVRAGVRWGEG